MPQRKKKSFAALFPHSILKRKSYHSCYLHWHLTYTFQDSTVVVFDVGRNTSECVTKNGQSFLELEKECAKKIFMRKVRTITSFIETKHLISGLYCIAEMHSYLANQKMMWPCF